MQPDEKQRSWNPTTPHCEPRLPAQAPTSSSITPPKYVHSRRGTDQKHLKQVLPTTPPSPLFYPGPILSHLLLESSHKSMRFPTREQPNKVSEERNPADSFKEADVLSVAWSGRKKSTRSRCGQIGLPVLVTHHVGDCGGPTPRCLASGSLHPDPRAAPRVTTPLPQVFMIYIVLISFCSRVFQNCVRFRIVSFPCVEFRVLFWLWIPHVHVQDVVPPSVLLLRKKINSNCCA